MNALSQINQALLKMFISNLSIFTHYFQERTYVMQ